MYPIILNSILDLENNTYKKGLCLQVEYFVDTEEYFFFKFIHIIIAVFSLNIISGSTGIIYLVSTHHAIAGFNAIG